MFKYFAQILKYFNVWQVGPVRVESANVTAMDYACHVFYTPTRVGIYRLDVSVRTCAPPLFSSHVQVQKYEWSDATSLDATSPIPRLFLEI